MKKRKIKLKFIPQRFCRFITFVLCLQLPYLLIPSTVFSITVEEIKQIQTISPPSKGAYDHFGASVAVSGNILALGAPRFDSFWEDSGAVYLYHKIDGKWQYLQKLQANAPRQGGLFGYTLALVDSYLYVGEPGSELKQSGKVHIFLQQSSSSNGWSWIRSLSRPDDCRLNTEDSFGSSVSSSGKRLLIGSPKACKSEDEWYETTGAAYLYTNHGASYLKKITASNGDDSDHFGTSVSLCGQYAFVGAPDADNGQSRLNSGAAYVYIESTNWSLHRFINPQDTIQDDQFGMSTSCFGNYAAIGAPSKSKSYGTDDRKGFVNIYGKDKGGGEKWGLTQRLNEENHYNEDPDRNNLFGSSVSLNNDFLIVGDGESEKNGSEQEPAGHIFKLIDGVWKFKLSIINDVDTSCEPSATDIGYAVSTDGIVFVVGDMEDEADVQNCSNGLGSVKIFSKNTRNINNINPVYLLLDE